MNSLRHVFMGIGAALLVSTAAVAHHGWTGYNEEARKLSGVIEESSYVR